MQNEPTELLGEGESPALEPEGLRKQGPPSVVFHMYMQLARQPAHPHSRHSGTVLLTTLEILTGLVPGVAVLVPHRVHPEAAHVVAGGHEADVATLVKIIRGVVRDPLVVPDIICKQCIMKSTLYNYMFEM